MGTEISCPVDYHLIDRGDAGSLIVGIRRLSKQDRASVPFEYHTPLRASLQAAASFVVDWNLRAKDENTGSLCDVPPPAIAGSSVFEIIENETLLKMLAVIKVEN